MYKIVGRKENKAFCEKIDILDIDGTRVYYEDRTGVHTCSVGDLVESPKFTGKKLGSLLQITL